MWFSEKCITEENDNISLEKNFNLVFQSIFICPGQHSENIKCRILRKGVEYTAKREIKISKKSVRVKGDFVTQLSKFYFFIINL